MSRPISSGKSSWDHASESQPLESSSCSTVNHWPAWDLPQLVLRLRLDFMPRAVVLPPSRSTTSSSTALLHDGCLVRGHRRGARCFRHVRSVSNEPIRKGLQIRPFCERWPTTPDSQRSLFPTTVRLS